MNARLRRIARLGAALCSRPAAGTDADGPPGADSSEIEARLFFNYLTGDFQAAAADLEALGPHISALDHRLSLLSVRAQILWSKGQQAEARDVIRYLLSTAGAHTERIEETPLGPVVTTEVSPDQAWARYLSMRAANPPPAQTQPANDLAGGFADPRPPDPFDGLELRGLERMGVGLPFGPADPGQAGQPAAPNRRLVFPEQPFEPRF